LPVATGAAVAAPWLEAPEPDGGAGAALAGLDAVDAAGVVDAAGAVAGALEPLWPLWVEVAAGLGAPVWAVEPDCPLALL
jgi:hypothetical protein